MKLRASPKLSSALVGAGLFGILLMAAPAVLHAQDSNPTAGLTPSGDPLVPVATLSSPTGPQIYRLPSAAPGTVAMRLSVPVTEAAIEAGSAQVIASLARARLIGLVAPLGISADVSRTPWGLAYTVAGPQTDFDYLAWVLREVTGEPNLARVGEARTLLQRDWIRRQETGRGRVELNLRTATSLSQPPLLGTAATIAGISPASVQELWIRTHQATRMTLVISGEVSDELLLASFDRLGATADPGPPPSVPVPAGPSEVRLDLLRTSAGVAWSAAEPLSPEAAVAAVLLADQLRASDPGFEASVSVWESTGHSSFGIVGAAFRQDLSSLRSWLSSGLERLSDGLTEDQLAQVTAALRADVLSETRTPLGQVRLTGRFLDAGLQPEALRDYLGRLASLELVSFQATLAQLGQDPVRTEVTR